jgi:hydroxyacylglutathione hydrolase
MITFKENETFAHSYLICRFDSCYIIDPSHDEEAVIKALDSKKLLGVLLTHAHFDHIHLIGSFDVPIYIHQADAHLLFEDKYNGYAPHQHPYKRKLLDLRYVENKTMIPLADQFISVLHTPGHTQGSVCYLYDDKLFTGDTLFKESVGRHDLYSGSLVDLRRSIVTLATLNSNIKIYPGHDSSTTLRHEIKNNPFINKWLKQKNG